MGIRTIKYLLIPIFFLCSFQVQGQGVDVPVDSVAINMVSLGKKYFHDEEFISAGQTFEFASERPFNQSTTFAVYMAGLSYYKAKEYDLAKMHFNAILKDFSKSRYFLEAKYHKALMLMDTDDNSIRELGLDLMLAVADETKEFSLKKDALQIIRHYLFNVFSEQFLVFLVSS